MSDHQPLTLERWAALDQAASSGPWDADSDGEYFPIVGQLPQRDIGRFNNGHDAQFTAASRQAPTRLLAALRGLAAEWDTTAQLRSSAYMVCADELRHLIATLDLSQPR